MADTRRTLSALQTLLANNSTGDISAQDLRDMLVSCFPTGQRLLATQTASNSASLDFTTRNASFESGALFQSDFNQYLFILEDVLPATTGTHLLLRFSSNGGSSYISSGYVYGNHYDSTANDHGVYNSSQSLSSGFELANTVMNTASYGGAAGDVRVFNPDQASIFQRARWFTHYRHNANSNIYHFDGNGVYNGSSVAMDSCQFLFSSGNITSGVIRCYGYAQ
jgi:hypothetical protein